MCEIKIRKDFSNLSLLSKRYSFNIYIYICLLSQKQNPCKHFYKISTMLLQEIKVLKNDLKIQTKKKKSTNIQLLRYKIQR